MAGKTGAKLPKAEGVDFIQNFFDEYNPYDVKELTIEDIQRYKDHYFAEKIRDNLKNMILQGPPIINVQDPDGNSQEDQANWLRGIAEDIELEKLLNNTWDCWCNYGTFIRSVGMDRINNQVVITEVKDLPPETFVNAGLSVDANPSYGKLLKGIVRYEDGSIHYWQTSTYETAELLNCGHVNSPKTSYYIDGVPILTPLYQLLPKLNLFMDGLIQSNYRANTVFLRQNSKQNMMPDGKSSVWGYLQLVLKMFSRNTFFPLPPETEPIELTGPVSDISEKSINLVTKLIISVYSPTDFMSGSDGRKLGGSTAGETELVESFVIGYQTALIKPWITLFQQLLEYNGYLDYKVQIKLPRLKSKNDELEFKKAQELIKAAKEGYVIGSINEVRELLNLEDADTEFLNKAKSEWEEAKVLMDTVQPVEQLPAKEEQLNDEEIKDEEEALKENQGEEELEEELAGHFKTLFKSVDKLWEASN